MAGESSKTPTRLDLVVGRNLRVWRLARRMSQSDLASRLDVTFQQLQKYEIGKNRVGTGRLVKLAAILEVPAAALLAGTEDGPPSADAVAVALIQDERAFRLASAFADIKDEGLRLQVVAFVEKLAEKMPQESRPKLGRPCK